ncbi:hypothetical protein BU14_0229s0025 [Porphyra umbilicalis]|uniref:Amine oxidase domain-containing protein n=1 Tax=Porphyra umbilicalis TaxID=2786 RepID=A0A1X6P457_PORUM|nr:hypothetical protein BU14_0229s0025 [Porphyra umbilicalis]|eukprot:OSX75637.1 hypothetical protein BU14_0229s0025 [Porphyra umbilicalis]
MASSLGSTAYTRWLSFLDSANVAFEVGFRSFVDRRGFPGRLGEIPDLLRMCFALGGNPLAPMNGWLASVFRGVDAAGGAAPDGSGVVTEERLLAMASFQNLYVGLSPYKSPATFALLSSLEAKQGVYYPVGGMVRVAEALATIAERAGVTLRPSTRVAAVVPSGDGKTAIGVQLADGTFLPADVVVSNVDLPTAEATILPARGSVTPNNDPADPLVAAAPPLPSRGVKAGRRYSSGVVSLLFATDRVWGQLSHHTIFAVTSSAADRRGAWAGLFEPGLHLPAPCNFYVHSPARTDASAAPPGGDAIMVLVPVGHLADAGEAGADPSPEELRALEARARDAVVARFEAAGLTGFADSIVAERAFTPAMWRARYGLARGAAFGLAHDARQLSLFRQAPRDGALGNVYHVGASARPGNGVPLVLIGAEHVAATVVEDTPGLSGGGVAAAVGGGHETWGIRRGAVVVTGRVVGWRTVGGGGGGPCVHTCARAWCCDGGSLVELGAARGRRLYELRRDVGWCTLSHSYLAFSLPRPRFSVGGARSETRPTGASHASTRQAPPACIPSRIRHHSAARTAR